MRSVSFRVIGLLAAAAAMMPGSLPANAAERSQIPEKYTWKLDDTFAGEAAWEAARRSALERIPEVARFKGNLGDSAGTLFEALSSIMDLDRDLDRVRSYASWTRDQDTRVGRSQEMFQEADQAMVSFKTAIAFLRPEILSLDPAKVRGFVAADPRLSDYAFYLDDILRRKPHTLSPAEEGIAARSGSLASAGEAFYSIFTNADFPYPEVDAFHRREGPARRVGLHQVPRFLEPRGPRRRCSMHSGPATGSSSGRSARRCTPRSRRICSTGTSTSSRVRSTPALFEYAIPTAVYRQLIADVHANLPTLHRYLELRQRMMGLDKLGYEDLYAPIVKAADLTFTPEQAMELTLEAFAPLGTEYVDTLRKGYGERWVDFLPSTGKRSGAYSETAYGVHPYQLLNFMGRYDDVSTLAHESGHSMHSYLSDKHQPYVTHDYSTFVAEVASTLNENLLFQQDAATRRQGRHARGSSCWGATSTSCARRSSGRRCSPSSSWRSTRRPSAARRSPARS